MSYKVLALKWRPKLFQDAIGQEHITRTLKNSILNKKIGHAYLLTGTRGIGKTTIARIFAKAIRCENLSAEGEPCLVCGSCQEIESGGSLDYQEIDGASNNSVDDVRDLIENVQYLPTSGEYKVYIIDEVHMLSVNAFNALLKTLEEPPKHVIFVFATTDPQKLLGTVLSRCLRFDFRNASEELLVKHINFIAKEEGIKFASQIIPEELAKQARGSFRDVLSLFDQVISLSLSNEISEETLYTSLGMANSTSVNKMIEAILLKKKPLVHDIFGKIVGDNIDYKNFSLQITNKLYDIICKVSENQEIASEELNTALSSVSLTELMWIYETLIKDFEWSFDAIEPQKATCFAFMKTAVREMILKQDNLPLNVKKKVIKTETSVKEIVVTKETKAPVQKVIAKPEIKTPVEEAEHPVQEVVVPGPKSWDGFLEYLYKNNKLMAINVERGNLINKQDFGKKDCVYHIGFSNECQIFFDYLVEGKNSFKLKELLCAYLAVDIEEIELNLKVLDSADEEGFLSSVDIVNKDEADKKEARRQDLLNNKYIKNAQELFSSEINKVVLNK